METNSGQKPHIVISETPGVMADLTLKYFSEYAKRAIAKQGIFRVAISGGSTPVRFYERLAKVKIDWDKIHIFWVDERCVPPSSEASNFGLATHTFLLDVPIPGENIHRVAGETENYADAVAEYEQVIRSVFKLSQGHLPKFDLIILGMGSDGHIGSILPNTYAQFDTDDLVSAVYRMDGDYNRITLTIPVMKESERILILVSGKNKAPIVKDVFQTEPDPVKYPVHSLWPVMHKIRWLIDQDAAALLKP
jgi:6-phosphogluconolactonase